MDTQAAYDPVAALYERAFADIRVRSVELAWLKRALRSAGHRPRVLDVGAGNGALLEALAPRISQGVGVDISAAMLAFAERRAARCPNLRFQALTGATLPFADGSFDVVVSCLSFRYLVWQEIWPEIRRVLAEGGRFLLVDLVRERAGTHDAPRLLASALRHARTRLSERPFTRDLAALTRHPDWARMLERHPMRPLAEYRNFFAQELGEPQFVALDVLPSRRVVALDTGPLHRLQAADAREPRACP